MRLLNRVYMDPSGQPSKVCSLIGYMNSRRSSRINTAAVVAELPEKEVHGQAAMSDMIEHQRCPRTGKNTLPSTSARPLDPFKLLSDVPLKTRRWRSSPIPSTLKWCLLTVHRRACKMISFLCLSSHFFLTSCKRALVHQYKTCVINELEGVPQDVNINVSASCRVVVSSSPHPLLV